ncbi:MAG: N-6 DNA methylase [Pseudolabrys sp.]|jgi:type I restriction-modification system DNA methylase subunit
MSKNENTTFPRRFPTGQFDFVLANPPFNVNAVDKERLKDSVGPGRRFAFGLPRTDNANYLWIPLFYSARPTPRAAPGSSWPASDARTSEQELRQKLIGALREKRAGCRLIVPSLPTDKKTCLYSPIGRPK